MRKFSMCQPCRAFVACPGGYGTFDELFEVLTLMQSGKIELAEHMPVVLFGVKFWKSVVNFEYLLESGVISPGDVDRLFFTDSIDDAFNHITAKLLEYEAAKAVKEAAAAAAALAAASSAAAAANRLAMQSATKAAAAHKAAVAAVAEGGDGLALEELPQVTGRPPMHPPLRVSNSAVFRETADDGAFMTRSPLPDITTSSAAMTAAAAGIDSETSTPDIPSGARSAVITPQVSAPIVPSLANVSSATSSGSSSSSNGDAVNAQHADSAGGASITSPGSSSGSEPTAATSEKVGTGV